MKKILLAVLFVMLMTVPAFALDGQLYGGGSMSSSQVSSGGGGGGFSIVSTQACNVSGANASINWAGPQVSANTNTFSSGGTKTFALGDGGGGAHQSGSAFAGAGFIGFHIGF